MRPRTGARADSAGASVQLDAPGAQSYETQVNGVPRRASALAEDLRIALSRPGRCSWSSVAEPPRPAALDEVQRAARPEPRIERARVCGGCSSGQPAAGHSARGRPSVTSSSALGRASSPRAAIVAARLRLLELMAEPLAAAHREIAPDEGQLAVGYVKTPGLSPGRRRARPWPDGCARDGRERDLERLDARRSAGTISCSA